MFKVFLLQSLAWLYDPLISLLLQAVRQVSLFKYLFYCKPSHKSKLKQHLNGIFWFKITFSMITNFKKCDKKYKKNV